MFNTGDSLRKYLLFCAFHCFKQFFSHAHRFACTRSTCNNSLKCGCHFSTCAGVLAEGDLDFLYIWGLFCVGMVGLPVRSHVEFLRLLMQVFDCLRVPIF